MVSMLIFSVGVLGIIGMLAAALQNQSDAKNRVDACFLVDQLVGQMWADHLLTSEALQAKYSGGTGTDGPGYTAWLNGIIDPNNPKLPGVAANANVPQVTVTSVDGAAPPATTTSVVNVTLFWHPPNGTGPPHQYTVITEIK